MMRGRRIAAAAVAHRTIWRWHFYAGLFCLPFIVVLSLSGSVFLFKPQIDAWIDRPFDHLTLNGPLHSIDDQVATAQAATPTARLRGVELNSSPDDATRVILMTPKGGEMRVYIRPDTLEILKITADRDRFTMIVRRIHGELLAGNIGAIAVELAGAWAIVMVVTGLYLWWPRHATGWGGILYPRLGNRRFLRDLHGVTGFWISVFALFFLISALPWTKVWGGGFRAITQLAATGPVNRDWTTGPSSEHAMHMESFRDSAPSAQEEKMDMDNMAGMDRETQSFDRIVSLARPMGLAEPVLISRPSGTHANWTIRSDAPNRMARVTLELDPQTGAEVHKSDFGDKALVDKAVGVGVSIHEGQLFGWPNQALGLITAAGYLTLTISAVALWWRRRPKGVLGAPQIIGPMRLAPAVALTIVLMGLLLPVLGISLIAVLLVERAILTRIPAARLWLGLQGAR
jgi:uncharacterized iron-regulated membrane protein